MPERIYKLQPNRTIHLRGFDDLGAAAALHSATPSSFKVSGVFRDAADFAVVILYDADNFFEHPRLKYLPDFDFAGLTLQFDVHYDGLMPLDSPKYPTIAWPFLEVVREDGSPAQIRFFDHAEQVGGTYAKAKGSFTVAANEARQNDRVTLWYLNYPFSFVVGQTVCSYVITGSATGAVHWIEIDGTRYQTTQVDGDTNTSIAGRLADLVAASPLVTVTVVVGNQIDIENRSDGGSYLVASSADEGVTVTLGGSGPNAAAQGLAAAINTTDFSAEIFGLSATVSGATIHIEATRPGIDGDFVNMYATWSSDRLKTVESEVPFSFGSSNATWRVTLDFQLLGISRIRQMWMTFAPPLRIGEAIEPTEWTATFTNWTLLGPEEKRMLQVAGLDSVRVEEDDSWCTYSGNWVDSREDSGFFSGGFARGTTDPSAQVTVKYACPVEHDLYIGTTLHQDRGSVGVRLDNDTEESLDCYLPILPSDSQVHARRRVRSGVPPGEHSVTIRMLSDKPFYFDFLEAAVPSDVPDNLPAVASMAPAMDYSTDHTYKLPPARILWAFDKLGFAGPLNVYLGVFWWNQRDRVGAYVPNAFAPLGGQFVDGDGVFVEIGDQKVGKTVLGGETPELIAAHFERLINAKFVGVYAKAQGNILEVFSRSPKAAYAFPFNAWAETVTGSTGSVIPNGHLLDGIPGTWRVDPARGALNAGARAWLADLFAECKARNREVTIASSMELVNPPPEFPARYPDGLPVETVIGFGSLLSTHCAFSSPMLAYHKTLFAELAAMMTAAQLTPNLQLGEFVWWFFTNYSAASNPAGGMAFHDPDTAAAAAATLGRPLHVFRGPNDDPGVNGGADAVFLANRLREYAAAIISHVKSVYPVAKFELLYPYDVNHPEPVGVHNLGGALNRFVNFPEAWANKASSGFDRLKMEGLNFGAWTRDLNLCRKTIEFPLTIGWPKDSVRYLAPVFRAKSVWDKEYLIARGLEIPVVNFWAYDHVCLFGLDPSEPRNPSRVFID